MKRLVFALILCLALAGIAAAQQNRRATPRTRPAAPEARSAEPQALPCQVATAPIIRGLKLGMTTDEVQAVLPRMRLQPADENGERMASVLRPRNEETDAESINLKFLDDKLTFIEVRYSLEWDNMDEFVARVSAALSLPANAWRASQTTTNRRNMQCPGFHIEVEMLSTSTTTIRLYDPTTAAAIAQRIRARETRRRQAFIP